MMFKNVSGKVVFLKIDKEFVSVQSNKVIDLGIGFLEDERFSVMVDEPVKEIVEEIVKEELVVNEPVEEIVLENMTKDELNDFAAKIGYETEIKASWKKAK